MKKLFNVVAGMEKMSHDQLKGAVRNMEIVANLVYNAYEALIAGTVSRTSVLGTDFNDVPDGIEEYYLPGVHGGTVVIPKSRPDKIIEWKLEFFNAFDNLELSVWCAPANSMHFYADPEQTSDLMPYLDALQSVQFEYNRSNAALYQSMKRKPNFK